MQDKQSTPSMLVAALNYARRGWRVFPVKARGKAPLTAHGFKEATIDEATIKAWWSEWPDANIGIACGPDSEIEVLDIDGPEGAEAFEKLRAENVLPETLVSITGRGRHYLFRWRSWHAVGPTTSKIAKGIDTKGAGGYIVAPPSTHASGHVYRWESEPNSTEVADWPTWLLDAVARANEPKAKPAIKDEFRTRSKREERYARKALESETKRVRDAAPGKRNDELNRSAFALGQLIGGGLLSEAEVKSSLESACHSNGLIKADGATSVQNTIRSGIRAGRQNPRTAPERQSTDVRAELQRLDAMEAEIAAAVSRAGDAPSPAPPDFEDPPLLDEPEAQKEPRALWMGQLALGKGDSIKSSTGNCALFVEHDAPYSGCLGYDERNDVVTWTSCPSVPEMQAQGPYPRALNDSDIVWISKRIEQQWGVSFKRETLFAALVAVARMRPFDRVKDYLDALTWDKASRLNSWLATYVGVESTPFTSAAGAKWLISAVARVYEPASQADHVLVLEGPQGAGKSSALRALCADARWYSSDLPDLGNLKSAQEVLQGPWLIEIGELDAMKRAELSRVKAFITTRSDRYRAAYARSPEVRPRRVVFAGTTNEGEYLHDATGGRRFWPVTVGKIDVVALCVARDQIWAEAVARYRAGERWYLDAPELQAHASRAQQDRYASDPWEEDLAEHLQSVRTRAGLTPARISVSEALQALKIEVGKRGALDAKRVAQCLVRLGWRRVQRRDGPNGTRLWAYEPDPSKCHQDASLTTGDSVVTGHVRGDANQADRPNVTATQLRMVTSGDAKSSMTPPKSPLSPLSPLESNRGINRGAGNTGIQESGDLESEVSLYTRARGDNGDEVSDDEFQDD
jgi:predicted P-loop ATPase